ncbi:MAG: hypothetical protein ABL957_08005 [Parvularculaceae bacterium]
MEFLGMNIWALLGFAFAAYSVVANDALQTLGAFINSNKRLPGWALFLYAGTVLVIVFYFGWMQFDGDPSWGRLSNTEKFPVFEVQWYHVLPAITLVVITRFGLPVSTGFMILSIFATTAGIEAMVKKSLTAYAFAFALGLGMYAVLAPTVERFILRTPDHAQKRVWILLQWLATGYLWAAWLIQDFSHIFVYMPRHLSGAQAMFGVGLILVFLFFTFLDRGGPVQKVLLSKTSVTDIRSATIMDFTYASVLALFAQINNTPMSTTWAFLGLIAGREFAIATIDKVRSPGATFIIVFKDALKAFIGLVISIGLALSLPRIAAAMAEGGGLASLLNGQGG